MNSVHCKPAPEQLIADFDHYRFFPNQDSGDAVGTSNSKLTGSWSQSTRPASPISFINIGETHHRYAAKGHDSTCDWGDAKGMRRCPASIAGIRRWCLANAVCRVGRLLRFVATMAIVGAKMDCGDMDSITLRHAGPDGDERPRGVIGQKAVAAVVFRKSA